MFNKYVLQDFSGKWITTALRGCASFDMKTNVATTWQSTTVFWQASNGCSEQSLWIRSWTSGLAHSVSWLERIRFLSVWLHKVEVCGGTPETKHQSVEAIDEADVAISNEMEHRQWQYWTAQLMARRMQGAFQTCVITTSKRNCSKHLKCWKYLFSAISSLHLTY
jgi:hypothetical protein